MCFDFCNPKEAERRKAAFEAMTATEMAKRDGQPDGCVVAYVERLLCEVIGGDPRGRSIGEAVEELDLSVTDDRVFAARRTVDLVRKLARERAP